MNFRKATEAEAAKTTFEGYVNSTYAQLLDLFGEPVINDPKSRVKAEWNIVFDDKTIVSIYDYMESSMPTWPYEYRVAATHARGLKYIQQIVGKN